MRHFTSLSVLLLLAACSSDEENGAGSLDAGVDPVTPVEAGAGASEAGSAAPPDPTWAPGVVLPSPVRPTARGLLDLRGLIHEHSVNSHDACDDAPRDANGNIDEQCFQDFHDGMCAVSHDFVMLTDHDTFFSEVEYPQTLLYRSDRGDTLVERDGAPVANRAACADGHSYLILAGFEAGTMSVGVERHVAATAAERSAVYGARTPDAITQLKGVGAVVLVAHTEEFTPDELVALPLDGFEMYNLHRNLLDNLGQAIPIIGLATQPDQLMHPDLVIMGVITEIAQYLSTWGTVLSRGVRRITTLGTDAHRNTLTTQLPDGERVDSYRRLNLWFSNHLLVRPTVGASWDDRSLKEALSSGRLYGVFEYLGYAEGFDYYAEQSGQTLDMGAEASVAAGATLHVTMPRIRGLDPAVEVPELTLRLLRAIEGGWEEVGAAVDQDLTAEPTAPGAYRAEVRMRPRHLRGELNNFADLADADFVWIYSNPIYVAD